MKFILGVGAGTKDELSKPKGESVGLSQGKNFTSTPFKSLENEPVLKNFPLKVAADNDCYTQYSCTGLFVQFTNTTRTHEQQELSHITRLGFFCQDRGVETNKH